MKFVLNCVLWLIRTADKTVLSRPRRRCEQAITVIRPPDIVCRRNYILPVFLSFFFLLFFRRLISEVAERNSTKIGHMVGSKCNLKSMSEIWDTPSPYKSEAQKPPFLTTSQLNGNFNGLYLRNETRYRQSVKCIDNYKGLLHRPKTSWTLVHKPLQTRPTFLPTLCKFRIPLHCQSLQTVISKRNSTTLCQTVNSRPL